MVGETSRRPPLACGQRRGALDQGTVAVPAARSGIALARRELCLRRDAAPFKPGCEMADVPARSRPQTPPLGFRTVSRETTMAHPTVVRRGRGRATGREGIAVVPGAWMPLILGVDRGRRRGDGPGTGQGNPLTCRRSRMTIWTVAHSAEGPWGWRARAHVARGAGLLLVLVAVVGCAPNEPSSKELAATTEFAAAMPGAVSLATSGGDARWTIEGGDHAYATHLYVSPEDDGAVVAWYAALLTAGGWQRAPSGYVGMSDGGSTSLAWRRGGLVIGLGFPERGWLRHLGHDYPAGTLYEVTITYRPAPAA